MNNNWPMLMFPNDRHIAKRAELVKQKAELNAKLAINSNEPKRRGAMCRLIRRFCG